MRLETIHQVETTRRKLALLEEHYEEVRQKPAADEHVRELTLRSLKKFINQLKEEIVRFEAHRVTHAKSE
jgi:flagellar biosynthesis chaperone FliJ